MSAQTIAAQTRRTRRSKRLGIAVLVSVRGTGTDGSPVIERTKTVSINDHGALIILSASIPEGSRLSIENKCTGEIRECRAVSVLPATKQKFAVGVEFLHGATGFWGLYFPRTRTRRANNPPRSNDLRYCKTAAISTASLIFRPPFARASDTAPISCARRQILRCPELAARRAASSAPEGFFGDHRLIASE
jgi:hypothetical protein